MVCVALLHRARRARVPAAGLSWNAVPEADPYLRCCAAVADTDDAPGIPRRHGNREDGGIRVLHPPRGAAGFAGVVAPGHDGGTFPHDQFLELRDRAGLLLDGVAAQPDASGRSSGLWRFRWCRSVSPLLVRRARAQWSKCHIGPHRSSDERRLAQFQSALFRRRHEGPRGRGGFQLLLLHRPEGDQFVRERFRYHGDCGGSCRRRGPGAYPIPQRQAGLGGVAGACKRGFCDHDRLQRPRADIRCPASVSCTGIGSSAHGSLSEVFG